MVLTPTGIKWLSYKEQLYMEELYVRSYIESRTVVKMQWTVCPYSQFIADDSKARLRDSSLHGYPYNVLYSCLKHCF